MGISKIKYPPDHLWPFSGMHYIASVLHWWWSSKNLAQCSSKFSEDKKLMGKRFIMTEQSLCHRVFCPKASEDKWEIVIILCKCLARVHCDPVKQWPKYIVVSEITIKKSILALPICLLHTRTQSIHRTCSNLQHTQLIHRTCSNLQHTQLIHRTCSNLQHTIDS
jgi:hypothetical protein